MNEELSIIIRAVTDGAKKNIQGVKKQLGDLGKEGGKSSGILGKAFKGVAIGAAAAVGAVAAVTTALVAMTEKTKEYRKEQAKLTTAFLAAGSTTEQAAETYKNLYRFLGDSSKATEAANHLALLTTNEKELAEWTTTLQGVYATFGDSLPIEGLTEAANETAKVGQVTGGLADALNWAGISEDAFNAQLAATNSEAEREALIRGTLNSVYADAAAIYEKNNAALIAQNEAQARLEATTGRLGRVTQPLQTALTNLSNTLLVALEPAITAVSNAMTWLMNIIGKAISYISAFFGIVGGKSEGAFGGVATGVKSAASGAGALTKGLDKATASAEKLKRSTMGFDELNIVSDNSSSSSGAAGGSAGGAAAAGGLGGFALDTSTMDNSITKTGASFKKFVDTLKSKVVELKNVFAPTIGAISDLFKKLSGAWDSAKVNFTNGFDSIKQGFGGIFSYLTGEFIPSIVNSWSVNILPMFGDLSALAITEAGKSFEWVGNLFNDISTNIITPALETIRTIYTDVFSGIGKAWDKHGAPIISKFEEFTAGIRETLTNLYEQFLKPLWESFMGGINELWEKYLKPLWDKLTMAVGNITANLLEFWNKVLKPIVDWVLEFLYPRLLGCFNLIKNVFISVAGAISEVIGGIIDVIDGLIDFVVGVFTGDWKKAWEGVKKIFSGIWDSLVAVIKLPLNLIIDAINALLSSIAVGVNTAIKAINKLSFTVPEWVPEIGGKKFGFNIKELKAPQIPKLATGGIVTSETLARIGEGGKKEAVLPLEQNTAWMDMLADKIAAKNAAPTKIVLQLNEKELGWANIQSINSITQQTGALQLTLV